MLATMCPDIVFARLPVILTCGIVTALLGFILIKIEFHSHPLSVGSHAKKGIGYPMRVLISIVPSYTTQRFGAGFTPHIAERAAGVTALASRTAQGWHTRRAGRNLIGVVDTFGSFQRGENFHLPNRHTGAPFIVREQGIQDSHIVWCLNLW